MIAKKYRLSEKEIRKVFREKKPFFSSLMIANVQKNSLGYTRVAVLLSGKNTAWSVNRNFFRRQFYDFFYDKLDFSRDIVIVMKKWVKLSHKNPENISAFSENLDFLYKKIFS